MGALAAAVLVGTAWQSSYPGAVADLGILLLLGLGLAWLLLSAAVLRWCALVVVRNRAHTRWSTGFAFGTVALLISTVVSAFTDVDLEARFALSRSSLAELAADPDRWRSTPARFGLYRVESVTPLRTGEIRLTTHHCGEYDTCGFAYSPERELTSECVDYGGVDYLALSGGWYAFRTIEICPS